MPQGHLEVICGCMFSGKTEELIRRLKRANYARQRVQVFKHRLDDRYDELSLASHSGLKLPTFAAADARSLVQAVVPGTEVVGIDEVQFFGLEIVWAVEELVRKGLRVVASGLDLDFRGEPFGPMPQLLARAEMVDKLTAICVLCGQPATRSQRLIDGHPAPWDAPVVSIGSSEQYQPRCRSCHVVPGAPGHRDLSPWQQPDLGDGRSDFNQAGGRTTW